MNRKQRKAIADECRRVGVFVAAVLTVAGYLERSWFVGGLVLAFYVAGVIISRDILSKLEDKP